MGKLAQMANRTVSTPTETAPAPSEPGTSNPASPPSPVNPARSASLDPRPDLAEDHRDWAAVLMMCRHDKELFGLLHGLRCGGARLEIRQTKDGKDFYKLDYTPLLEEWSEDELRREWLMPNYDRMKAALQKGLEAKRTVDLQMEQEAKRAKRLAELDAHVQQSGLKWEI